MLVLTAQPQSSSQDIEMPTAGSGGQELGEQMGDTQKEKGPLFLGGTETLRGLPAGESPLLMTPRENRKRGGSRGVVGRWVLQRGPSPGSDGGSWAWRASVLAPAQGLEGGCVPGGSGWMGVTVMWGD